MAESFPDFIAGWFAGNLAQVVCNYLPFIMFEASIL